jgi:hypothetical protein
MKTRLDAASGSFGDVSPRRQHAAGTQPGPPGLSPRRAASWFPSRRRSP